MLSLTRKLVKGRPCHNETWSTEETMLGYRSQSYLESAFRDMKNPHFLGWSPMHHWTESKIRVHAFCCVPALALISLLQRTLHQQNVDLSRVRLLELLSGIKEVLLLYPCQRGERQPRTGTCLSAMDVEQENLFKLLQLERYQGR